MKRLIALILAAALLLLCGCSPAPEASAEESISATLPSEAPETLPTEAPTTETTLPPEDDAMSISEPLADTGNTSQEDDDASDEIQTSVDADAEDAESELPETQNLGIKKSNYQTSRGSESELAEVQNLGIKKFDNPISRSSKIVPQEVQKSNSKYNNNSYTDMSYINQSYQSDNPERCDGFDETVMLMSLVKSNIEYDSIMQNAQWKDWELYEELYEIICEVVCVKRKNVRIGGEDYPYELVKSKFMKLNSSHLLYVIECMQNTTSRITNIKSYMVTALYNAPNTMNHYYQQAVQHDMYGGGWQEKGIV